MSGLKLFSIGVQGAVMEITARPAARERHLQELVERNMETFLDAFLASEYSTGPRHRGRIDSLGLDENGSPVIVEYKRGCDSGVLNQGLFYLSWLNDHKAEFQLLVREGLGIEAASQVLWSVPRLVCVAESITRYDVHEIGKNSDLVTYRCFSDAPLALDTVASVVGPGRERRVVRSLDRLLRRSWSRRRPTGPWGNYGRPWRRFWCR